MVFPRLFLGHPWALGGVSLAPCTCTAHGVSPHTLPPGRAPDELLMQLNCTVTEVTTQPAYYYYYWGEVVIRDFSTRFSIFHPRHRDASAH
uniref:Putative secreted protein n=1 Tax=Anopheles marajoara TaxID=58244 RepID=A0A2M4C9W5_9DIPT